MKFYLINQKESKGGLILKIACIDDNKKDIQAINEIILNYSEIKIDYFYNTNNILDICHNYDSILIDIDIPVDNGLITAKRIRENAYEDPIVFISWHHEFEHESFAVHPFYFIKKEYLDYELRNCLNELLFEYHNKNDVFEIDSDCSHRKIAIKDILYIEREKNGISIRLIKNKSFNIRCSLQDVLNKELYGFCNINRSVIINFQNVKDYDYVDEFIMKEGMRLYVSRRNRKKVYEEYLMYKTRKKI